MFLDFTISNFRSIKDPQTISFEAMDDTHLEEYFVTRLGEYRILKMAMILGANASGKSNVLQAFMLFPDLLLTPCENKASKIEYDRFALDTDVANGYSEMKTNFICGQTRYYYEVLFNNDIVAHELLQAQPFDGRTHKVYERTLDTTTMVSTISWGDRYRSIRNTRDLLVNLLPNRTLFGSYQNSNVDIPWMKEILDWANGYFMPNIQISGQSLVNYTSSQIYENRIDKNQVRDLLKYADIGIDDLHIEKKTVDLPKMLINSGLQDNYIPHLYHVGRQGKVSIDFEEESTGTRRWYELSSILLTLIEEPHFVAIDELESKLHPDLYQHFINIYLMNAGNSQLVFTTHMREFLDDRDTYRDDIVWLTEKNEWGETELYSLADFDSNVLRNTTNRYNAYRAGRLGGVPRLGSTLINKNN